MRIRMLKTENGSVDGIRVKQFAEGEQYDLTATAGERDLAAAFVGADLAVEVGVEPAPEVESPEPEAAAAGAPEAKRTGRQAKK